MVKIQAIESALQALEHQLVELNLWETNAPPQQALLSEQPFAVDTLSPTQWLQWVFLPKMHQALEQGKPPLGFEIAPYFEQALGSDKKKSALMNVIYLLDKAVANE